MSKQAAPRTQVIPKSPDAAVNGTLWRFCRTCRRSYQLERPNQRDCPRCKGSKARVIAWAQRHQTDLFPTPEPTPPPERPTIQQRFEAWLEAEPRTWALIREYAYQYLEVWLRRENGRRIGIDLIVSRVRWECEVQRAFDEPFKINNDFRSRISRKLIDEDKRFAELFEIREVKTP